MKPYERRETGSETFFKLATFNPKIMAYRAGKTTYPTEAAARKAARAKGQSFLRFSHPIPSPTTSTPPAPDN